MLLFHLVRKDILVAKNHLLLTMLIIGVVPLYLGFTAPSIPGPVTLAYMVILGEIIILQSIAQEEAKQPKTIALLCAAPYPRKSVVYAKYVLFFLFFAYCLAAHTTVAFFTHKANILDLTSVLAVMFFGVVLFGIYVPVEFRYGVVKAKIVFTVVILLLSMGPPLFARLFGEVGFNLSFLRYMSPAKMNIALVFGIVFVIALSVMSSVHIFSKKEL